MVNSGLSAVPIVNFISGSVALYSFSTSATNLLKSTTTSSFNRYFYPEHGMCCTRNCITQVSTVNFSQGYRILFSVGRKGIGPEVCLNLPCLRECHRQSDAGQICQFNPEPMTVRSRHFALVLEFDSRVNASGTTNITSASSSESRLSSIVPFIISAPRLFAPVIPVSSSTVNKASSGPCTSESSAITANDAAIPIPLSAPRVVPSACTQSPSIIVVIGVFFKIKILIV